jgi:uncharacterized membrane protein YesL
MAKVKQKAKQVKIKRKSPFSNYWNKTNILFLSAGVILLILGFYLMGFKPFDNPVSLSYSPVILLAAYLIVFPISILYKKK